MTLKPNDIIISNFMGQKVRAKIKSVTNGQWLGVVQKVMMGSTWRIGQEISDNNMKGVTIITPIKIKAREKITARNQRKITFKIRKI